MLLVAILEFKLQLSGPAQSTLDYVWYGKVEIIDLECGKNRRYCYFIAVVSNGIILSVKFLI